MAADRVAGLRKAYILAKELELADPDAAGSQREGLEEMFTVARLGASPTLRRSLSTTNATESLISIARTTTTHVKHWRDGEMRRWCAARMLDAQRSFRRIRGHRELPAFTKNSVHKSTVKPKLSHTPSRLTPQRETPGSPPDLGHPRGTAGNHFSIDATWRALDVSRSNSGKAQLEPAPYWSSRSEENDKPDLYEITILRHRMVLSTLRSLVHISLADECHVISR